MFQLVYIEKEVYGDWTAWYWIYLINNSNEKFSVSYETWGFTIYDDEVVKLEGKNKDLWILEPHSRILVEEQDIWALDFSWFVDLTLKWEHNYKINFDIWKWSPEWETINLDWFKDKWIIMNFEIQDL